MLLSSFNVKRKPNVTEHEVEEGTKADVEGDADEIGTHEKLHPLNVESQLEDSLFGNNSPNSATVQNKHHQTNYGKS